MAREIQLTKGYVALVDDEDFEDLARFKWCAKRCSRKGLKIYAVRRCSLEERKIFGTQQVSMHRYLERPPPDKVVDHGVLSERPPHILVTLDNRRGNLEIVTQEENMRRARTGWRRAREVLEEIEAILGG